MTTWTDDEAGGTVWSDDEPTPESEIGSDQVTFAQSGTDPVSEDVQGVLRRTVFITGWMSVADRAAIAAGTTTNIDTAIMNAHSALPTTGGEIVFPPFAGKYKLTAAPAFTKRVVLRGMGATAVTAAGQGSTVILKDSAATAAILSLSVDGSAIQDLEVEGEGGNTGDGIEIKAGRCRLTNVAVYSMGQDGIRIGDTAGTNCNLWKLDNVKSKSNTRHGIYIHDGSGGAPDVNGGTLIHPDVQSNGGDGINFDNARLNTLVGGATQSNTGAGIRLTASAQYNTVIGTDTEANAAASDVITTSGGVGNHILIPTALAANCTFGELNNRIEIGDYYHATTGIQFPATQVASSDVNTLDDYEEGTWTPTVSFGVPGDLAVTYSTQVGRYTKIGNQVTAHFEIVTSAFTHSTASGTFRIKGWPVNLAASVFPTGTVLMSGWTLASVSSLTLQANSTTDAAIVASRTGAAIVTLTTAHIGTGVSIVLYGQLTYRV